MAPFCIPAPLIIPLRVPVFGGPKNIDTNTKVELLCETYLPFEIFYTVDGTKPQPYVAIVQGSKTFKYSSPFYLPPGKITVKAVAVNANIRSMCSNVVTKQFEVTKCDPVYIPNVCAKEKNKKKLKPRRTHSVEETFDEIFESTEEEPLCSSSPVDDLLRNDINCHFEDAFINTQNTNGENHNNELDLPYSEEQSNNKQNKNEHGEGSNNTLKEFLNAELRCRNECSKVEGELANPSPLSEAKFCCIKCDVTLQQCQSCNKLNSVSSKFCIDCGSQLAKVCKKCSNDNPSMAQYCQHCGLKLDCEFNEKQDTMVKRNCVDCSVMVKPQLKSASVQKLPAVLSKSSQTTPRKTDAKKEANKLFELKQLPKKSPGRGYWHQQLDYICNHLKTYAYNNLDFRKSISEPRLSDFQGAYVTSSENNITVTLNFTPLVLVDKTIPTAPKDVGENIGC